MDKEWLEDYMHACINAKNKGKPCELFLPKQTRIPPEVLEDGKYDFNSEVVTKLFNSLDKPQQKTLLTLYSIKNGVKDYGMLKGALVNILTGNINNYNRGYF